MTLINFSLQNRLLIAILCMAFLVGGLTFYAGIVIPAASSLWGANAQGFVTRLVTWRFNAVATPVWLTCLWLTWPIRLRHIRLALIGMLIIQAGLWLTHYWMDSLLVADSQEVLDEANFYFRHQVYLWLTTGQILLGWYLLYRLLRIVPNNTSMK